MSADEDVYTENIEISLNPYALFGKAVDEQYHYSAFLDVTIEDGGETIPAGYYYIDGDKYKLMK